MLILSPIEKKPIYTFCALRTSKDNSPKNFMSVYFFTNLSKILAIQLLLAPIIVQKKGRIRRKISLKLQWPMGNATPCLRLTKLRFQVLSHIKMSTQLSFSPVAKMQKRKCILKRLQMDCFETILAFVSLPFFHKSQILRVFQCR